MLLRLATLILLSNLIAGAPAMAQPAHSVASVASVASPGNVLTVSVTVDRDGRPSYSVSRNGSPVITPSRLGFQFTDAPKFERAIALTNQSSRSFNERWEQPWGERRFVRNHYNELRVRLAERINAERSMDVVFRVYDDGIGFRYEFPHQPALKQVNILEELTEFAVADEATAWWIPAGEFNRYEYLYQSTPLAEVPQVHTPLTIRTGKGLHIAFHEAALVDYSSMWLRRVEGQRLRAVLAPSALQPGKVSRTAPFHTPWRTIQIADSAVGLAMSDLILNLNEANRLGDVSWVKPFKYVGVWWGMHLDLLSWGPGPRRGATDARVRRYIDFAARHGFRGVLVEGWNTGWGDGTPFNFTRPNPEFDIKAMATYARRKGVRLVGHHETNGDVANYERQLEDALDFYQKLGIDSVKSGYVADAGGIKALGADGRVRYEWHDGQFMSRHHLRVVTEAAKRRIAINPHEPIKDTGLRRTYPNWVAREGARGTEYDAWGDPPNPPEHVPELVFTRMLSGPMDFTPGVLSLQGRGQPLQSTIARQLALYVVIYSPIQMVTDLPEHYEAAPAPFQFIKDVPTDWEESLALNGEIGDFVTFARKDRNSEDWYLGSVTDEQERTLTVTLDFLHPLRSYVAEIYRDGPGANWREVGKRVIIDRRHVTARDSLTFRLAGGGGVAIRFVAGPRR